MQARTVTFANVASGDNCSASFALGRRATAHSLLFLPAITSCTMLLQASHLQAPSSADFKTMANPYGSGQMVFYPGAGGSCIPMTEFLCAAPAARILFSVAQAGPSSLAGVIEA